MLACWFNGAARRPCWRRYVRVHATQRRTLTYSVRFVNMRTRDTLPVCAYISRSYGRIHHARHTHRSTRKFPKERSTGARTTTEMARAPTRTHHNLASTTDTSVLTRQARRESESSRTEGRAGAPKSETTEARSNRRGNEGEITRERRENVRAFPSSLDDEATSPLGFPLPIARSSLLYAGEPCSVVHLSLAMRATARERIDVVRARATYACCTCVCVRRVSVRICVRNRVSRV